MQKNARNILPGNQATNWDTRRMLKDYTMNGSFTKRHKS